MHVTAPTASATIIFFQHHETLRLIKDPYSVARSAAWHSENTGLTRGSRLIFLHADEVGLADGIVKDAD